MSHFTIEALQIYEVLKVHKEKPKTTTKQTHTHSSCLCGSVVLLLFPLIGAMGFTNYNTDQFSMTQHNN